MPRYTLKYFDARGMAEVSRILFSLAEVKYEDKRMKQEEWAQQKSGTHLGKMPVLEIDGKSYGQSSAIARYLARTFGFYGKNELQMLQVDEVLGIIQDIVHVLMSCFYESDETRKAALKKDASEKKIPEFMGMFETLLQNNGAGGELGFFVGDTITVADIAVYDIIEKITPFLGDPLKNHPLITKSVKMVGANPKIKKWIETRPQTAT